MVAKLSVASLALLASVHSGESMARAADPTLHATGELGVEYNDNILAAPDTPPPGATDIGPPVEDVVIHYAAGGALVYTGARARLLATYAHPVFFYARHPGADTSADVLAAEGRFELSTDDLLVMRLDAGRASSSISTLSAADETTVATRRGGDSVLFTVGCTQEYARRLSQDWSLIQASGTGVSKTLGSDSGLIASSLELGPELGYGDHAFALLPSVSYNRLLGSADPTSTAPRDQVIVGSRARWKWTFVPPAWSLELAVGAVAALEGNNTDARPIGRAALGWSERGFGASLEYERGYAPDLFTGQSFFSDHASLGGVVPLWAEQSVLLRASGGFSNSRATLADQIIAEDVKTAVADASIGWYPELYPQIALRYQYTRQFDAPSDQILLPNFERNVVSLTVSYMFPPLAAARRAELSGAEDEPAP